MHLRDADADLAPGSTVPIKIAILRQDWWRVKFSTR